VNVTIHPVLARIIAQAINDRSTAQDMIDTLLYRRTDFKEADYLFWKDQHKAATAALDALGINVHSFDKDVREAFR